MTTSAVRRNGPYAPLGANYADDDAVALLDMQEDDRAELLYVRALAYCARDLRGEGYISDIALRAGKVLRRKRMDTVLASAARLAELGLWAREGDGYRIKSWLKWNKSWDELSRKRKADSERKKPHDEPDSATVPDGIRAESARKADGIQTESAATPSGVATPQHFTSLHDTSLHVPTTSGAVALIDNANAVAAFIEGAQGNGMDRPGRSIIGRVGKAAKQLIADGVNEQDVITAARRLGANGWDDLEREVRRLQAERRPQTKASTTDAKVANTLALAEHFREQDSA